MAWPGSDGRGRGSFKGPLVRPGLEPGGGNTSTSPFGGDDGFCWTSVDGSLNIRGGWSEQRSSFRWCRLLLLLIGSTEEGEEEEAHPAVSTPARSNSGFESSFSFSSKREVSSGDQVPVESVSKSKSDDVKSSSFDGNNVNGSSRGNKTDVESAKGSGAESGRMAKSVPSSMFPRGKNWSNPVSSSSRSP